MKTEENYFDEEEALADLLKDNIIFPNEREYSSKIFDREYKGKTIVLFAICNDIFGPAADAEDLTLEELKSLHQLWKEDKKWGSVKWICKKRNLQPWPRIKELMIKEGVWDETLESLEKNGFNKSKTEI